MLSLKNHPFAVEAHFESSLVLTFALPEEKLRGLIPSCLRLDLFENKYAFLAVAMVKTNALRPKGFPAFFGNDFFLIGYRIFVRYTDKRGKNLRGLYIIKSETNKKKMAFFGNIFTHYNYTTTDILIDEKRDHTKIRSIRSKFDVTLSKSNSEILLPDQSPFTDWKEARRFAGPLPFTFTYNETDKTVLIIEGVRQNWQPQPVRIESYHFDLLRELNLEEAVLANAFEVKDIPYHWKKGKMEKWN